MLLKSKKYLLCDILDQDIPLKKNGFVIPSILGLILLMSVATSSALNISMTHIRMIQSEKNFLNTFIAAEIDLIEAEKNLVIGLGMKNTISVETYKPKYFRNKSGISSQHYKITSLITNPLTQVQLQSTIRIDTPHASSKTKSKHIERLSWKRLSE